ncbi:ATP-dependent helicase [Candidatus Peregrinibacteria bacterium]|jgi:DNA helicase II / ATP-dependent DNA helicase PcrA|nr:ATP-dependent helicase [Candidatus Peregrinibacteria bacterium]
MQDNFYHQRLAKLNPEQKRAVEIIDGPVMVVAGPGTGKTEILGMRIAYILKNTDTDPRNILVTTFTESGVQAIKKRLLEIIGSESYHVQVATFHGFCQQVISEFPEKFLFTKKLDAVSDLEKIEIIRSILKENKYEYLTTFGDPFFYVYDILRSISDLKREDVKEEDFKKILDEEEKVLEETKTINPRTQKPPVDWRKKETQLFKNKELLDVYSRYQSELKKRGLYDFEDMILFVVNAFKKDEDLLLNYQEQFLYILTDEYQDTNRAQNEILELLTSYASDLSPNIFVVGDDDQSIYRFQGASLENILDFKRRFPEVETVVLKSNYRSPQQVLDASYALIENNTQRLSRSLGVEKKLVSAFSVIPACPESQNQGEMFDVNSISLDSRLRGNDRGKKGNEKGIVGDSVTLSLSKCAGEAGEDILQQAQDDGVRVTEFSSETAEKFYILERVRSLLKRGVDPKEIAIFARKNSQVDAYAELLERNNIPVQFQDHSDLLKSSIIKFFLSYLKILSDPQDDEAMLKVLMHPSSNIESLKVYDVLQIAYKENFGRKFRKSLYEVIKEQKLEDFEELFLQLSELRSAHEIMSFSHFSEEVLKKSQILSWLPSQENHLELLRSISSFFQEIKSLNLKNHSLSLSEFLSTIDLYQEYGIKLKEDSLFLEKNGVQIMTAHKSKGLEFDYVFIVRAADKNWGNVRDFAKIKLPDIGGKVCQSPSRSKSLQGESVGNSVTLSLSKCAGEAGGEILRQAQDDKKSTYDKNEEERRLFFVALTRAKKQAEILYANEYRSGSSLQKTIPSQFIAEIHENLRSFSVYDDSQIDTEKYLLDFFKQSSKPAGDEKIYIQSLLKDYKLSVTHLEAYLKCPLAFKMKHLLKVPSVKNKYMALGTAFHRSLELFFHEYIQTKTLPEKSLLIRNYTSALEKELLTEDELHEMLKIGEDGLSGYFEEYKNSMNVPLANEYNFSQRNIYLEEAHLTGKIDKIELLKDREIKVVDYKTGSIKSDNVIEGNTKNSDGHLKRQILFYKILCDLDQGLSQKYEMVSGELDFVQGKDGKYAKKIISFTLEEVEDLKGLVLDVWRKIQNQEFEGCGERDCEFCGG